MNLIVQVHYMVPVFVLVTRPSAFVTEVSKETTVLYYLALVLVDLATEMVV